MSDASTILTETWLHRDAAAPAPSATSDRRCLVRLNVSESPRVLVCPNAIDGSPLIYREVVNGVTPALKVYGFDMRTRLREHRPFASVRATAEHYVDELLHTHASGPYSFFGFSSGGMLALEMARQLRELGSDVPIVVLGDTRTHDAESMTKIADLSWVWFGDIFIGHDMLHVLRWASTKPDSFWTKSTADRLTYLASLRARSAGADAALEETRRDYDVFQAYLRTYSDYEPRRYDGRTLFLTTGASAADVERWVRRLACTDCTIVDIGLRSHMQVVQPPGAARTAALLLQRVTGHAE